MHLIILFPSYCDACRFHPLTFPKLYFAPHCQNVRMKYWLRIAVKLQLESIDFKGVLNLSLVQLRHLRGGGESGGS